MFFKICVNLYSKRQFSPFFPDYQIYSERTYTLPELAALVCPITLSLKIKTSVEAHLEKEFCVRIWTPDKLFNCGELCGGLTEALIGWVGRDFQTNSKSRTRIYEQPSPNKRSSSTPESVRVHLPVCTCVDFQRIKNHDDVQN